jgi:hypothetical protein
MRCDRVSAMLERFVVGELSLQDQGTIQSHLTDCRKHDAALTKLTASTRRQQGLANNRTIGP